MAQSIGIWLGIRWVYGVSPLHGPRFGIELTAHSYCEPLLYVDSDKSVPTAELAWTCLGNRDQSPLLQLILQKFGLFRGLEVNPVQHTPYPLAAQQQQAEISFTLISMGSATKESTHCLHIYILSVVCQLSHRLKLKSGGAV